MNHPCSVKVRCGEACETSAEENFSPSELYTLHEEGRKKYLKSLSYLKQNPYVTLRFEKFLQLQASRTKKAGSIHLQPILT